MSVVVGIPLGPDGAPGELPDAVPHVQHDEVRVVLIRDGEPVVARMPMADLRALQELDDAEDAYRERAADAAKARWEAEGRPSSIPMEDVARDLGIDLTDTR